MSYHSVVIAVIVSPHPHGALRQAFEAHLGDSNVTGDRENMVL